MTRTLLLVALLLVAFVIASTQAFGTTGYCDSPVDLASVTNPTTTISTCNEATLRSALLQGGVIVFACSGTITVSSPLTVNLGVNTVIDGGGQVTISGGGNTRILNFDTNNYEATTPKVTVQNLAFTQGYSVGANGNVSTGGGAIYRNGGVLDVINCDFSNNQITQEGPDVSGGAIFSVGVGLTRISGCVFTSNSGSNGGAVGNLGNSVEIYNSKFTSNSAVGTSAGSGGSGGAIYCDGQGVDTTLCGVNVTSSSYNSFGGAIFRVGYTTDDEVTISYSWFDAIKNIGTNGFAAVYLQGMKFTLQVVTISNGISPGYGGVYVGPGSDFDLDHVTIFNNVVTGLGGGMAIDESAKGTIYKSTIAANTALFNGGIAGGASGNVKLDKSIIANNIATNGFNPINCGVSFSSNAGANFQWPDIRTGGGSDLVAACSSKISFGDPQLSASLGFHEFATVPTLLVNNSTQAESGANTQLDGNGGDGSGSSASVLSNWMRELLF